MKIIILALICAFALTTANLQFVSTSESMTIEEMRQMINELKRAIEELNSLIMSQDVIESEFNVNSLALSQSFGNFQFGVSATMAEQTYNDAITIGNGGSGAMFDVGSLTMISGLIGPTNIYNDRRATIAFIGDGIALQIFRFSRDDSPIEFSIDLTGVQKLTISNMATELPEFYAADAESSLQIAIANLSVY